ncbi:MAG: hypothetical protein PHQ58_04370 [Rhodoferax sp.]|uniref:hypothetical protein n=1 Tax=Rhodoferax sp. TaxID=50421 RepID=UPI002621EC5F|nr:hypothetical protein [Rhodoferax sp.]MDD2879650.1 hypothetical protein [Rhodoferax sp.]
MFEMLLLSKKKIAGVVPFAWFAGGYMADSVDISTSEKYLYDSNTVIPGNSLSLARFCMTSCGNAVGGIATGGFTMSDQQHQAVTDKLNYATGVVSMGTELSEPLEGPAAAGTVQVGLIAAGGNNAGFRLYSKWYTYSNDVMTSGANLITPRYLLGAVGNSTVAYFAGGHMKSAKTTILTSAAERYVYAGNVVTSSASLSIARSFIGACGNTEYGILAGGFNNIADHSVTEKYTYATNTLTQATSLPFSISCLAGAGNTEFALFAGGDSSTVVSNQTLKRAYATETYVAGSSLSTPRANAAPLSSTPGWIG